MAIPRTDPRSSSDQIWSNLARRLVPRRDEVRPWLPGGSGIGLCESAPQGKWRESSPTLGNHAAADHSVRRSPLTVARMPRLVIRIRTRETRPSHDYVWSEREAPPKEASESDAPPSRNARARQTAQYLHLQLIAPIVVRADGDDHPYNKRYYASRYPAFNWLTAHAHRKRRRASRKKSFIRVYWR